MEVRTVGIAWFTRDTYVAVRAIFEDADNLPVTYKDWLRKAERVRKEYQKRGALVVRAYIDLDAFPAWCRANGYQINSNGRQEYAAWYAARGVN